MSGLEFVQGLVTGTLPMNSMAETLGYDIVDVSNGRAAIVAEPNAAHLNPAGTGHGYTVSGFGFGMRIAQRSTIPADVFAGPHLGAILGVVQAGGGLGGAIGPFLGGWIFDVTGSYRLAFTAACVAVAGSAVAAWLATRPMASAPDAQP
jgi:nitrate/nitrite transporter NarK